jgi:glucose/arabinose dehydrogenase
MKFHIFLLSLVLPLTAATAQTLTDSSLVVTQIVTGLDVPTAIAFLDTNDILVLEKDFGQVRRVIDGVLQADPVLDVAVDNSDERGLLGIALHPGFATNHFVYLCYTESSTGDDSTLFPDPLCICIYRYEWDGAVLTNAMPILSFPVESFVDYHNGGALTFGPDGKLYAVTGDHERFGQLQNQSFGGAPDNTSVIVRLNDDGSAPSDNPFFNVEGMTNVFAYGVRNSFGLVFDPVTGKLWDTENGEDDYDEINLVMPGFNSGWREIMGPDSRSPGSAGNLVQFSGSQYSDPEFSWLTTVAPTGISFLNSGALGEQYRNDLFVGDFDNGFLYHFDLNSGRNALVLAGGLSDKVADSSGERDNVVIGTGFSFGEGTESGISDLKVGPDGRLYVVSIGLGTIYAIYGTGGGGEMPEHNLAVVSVKPPKKITLSEKKPSQIKGVKISVQNLGNHTETIGSVDTLTNVVQFAIESLGGCPVPAMSLAPPKKGFPIVLAPKKKLKLVYNVTFDCANDPAKSGKKDPGHEDFRYTVSVNHAAIDGQADAEPENDDCPRGPSGSDKGCGGKDPVTKQLGADILTDVIQK